MGKDLLLSVVIATYNREALLRRVLGALEEQGEAAGPFEVVVADDGSTDGTASFLEHCRPGFPLRVVRAEHRGPAAARNAALEAARGKSVLFLNDDCLAAPGLLAQHRRTHRRHPGEAILGHIAWHPEVALEEEVAALVEEYYFPYRQIGHGESELSFAFFITGNLSVPLRAVLEAGGFDETYREAAVEDIDLGYRLQQRGLKLRYNREALVLHLHPLDFDALCRRQFMMAYWLHAFLNRHPGAAAFYPGLELLGQKLGVHKKECLRLILRYEGYRGARAGRKDFSRSGD